MSAESEAFSAMDAIESGRWDRSLLQLAEAIRRRLRTEEYRSKILVGDEN